MTVSGHLVYCEHGYCETEHCRTCEIMGVCLHCKPKSANFVRTGVGPVHALRCLR